jgi:hypothetical protein
VPIDQRAEEAFEWAMLSGAPRGFETQHAYTCRNVAEELALAGDSGQTDVIRLSVIDYSLPRFAIRKPTEGTFVTALCSTGVARGDGARGTR